MADFKNFDGTLRNAISIGKGSDKVGIRTLSGEIQAQDNGGPWVRITDITHSSRSGLDQDDHNTVYPAKEGRSGDMSTITLSGEIDDLANNGYTGLVFQGLGTTTLRGLAAAKDGKYLTIVNDTGNDFTISNNDSNSSANNRILTGRGADLSIPDEGSVTLQYEENSNKWRMLGVPVSIQASVSRIGALDIDGTTNAVDTNITLYTVPASTYPRKVRINITNRNSGTDALVRLAHHEGSVGNEDYILYDVSLTPSETKSIEIDGMIPGDILMIRSNVTDVTFVATSEVYTAKDSPVKIGAVDPSATTNTTLVSTDASTHYEDISISICNRDSANPASVRVALVDSTSIGNLAVEDYIMFDTTIAANESLIMSNICSMPPSSILAVYTSAATISFIAYGKEI